MCVDEVNKPITICFVRTYVDSKEGLDDPHIVSRINSYVDAFSFKTNEMCFGVYAEVPDLQIVVYASYVSLKYKF